MVPPGDNPDPTPGVPHPDPATTDGKTETESNSAEPFEPDDPEDV